MPDCIDLKRLNTNRLLFPLFAGKTDIFNVPIGFENEKTCNLPNQKYHNEFRIYESQTAKVNHKILSIFQPEKITLKNSLVLEKA